MKRQTVVILTCVLGVASTLVWGLAALWEVTHPRPFVEGYNACLAMVREVNQAGPPPFHWRSAI